MLQRSAQSEYFLLQGRERAYRFKLLDGRLVPDQFKGVGTFKDITLRTNKMDGTPQLQVLFPDIVVDDSVFSAHKSLPALKQRIHTGEQKDVPLTEAHAPIYVSAKIGVYKTCVRRNDAL